MESYKKCPFKKRPVIVSDIKEEPEDLSFKRMPKEEIWSSDSKRHFDLSSNSYFDCLKKSNELEYWYSSLADTFNSTMTNEPMIVYKDYHNTMISAQYEPLPNIHLRGLTNLELKTFDYESYLSPAQTYNHPETISPMYATEFAVGHLTPPSSPATSITSQSPEPEDLSLSSRKFFIESLLYSKNHHKPSARHPTKLPSKVFKSKMSCSNQAVYRFQCQQCRKSYSTCTGLSKHQQLHCPAAECNRVKKEFGCKSCNKVYTSLGALKMHIRTHTLPCKCPHCGKAFSRPWLLQGHIRTHTGEKPFSCSHCQRAFADRSNLRAHQQTHVEVKKYICECCSKSFSRMSLLSKHASGNCGLHIQSYMK